VLRYEIWDTAGQERFHSLAPMYYRNAQAAVVVYDVTKATSLEKAKSWVKELQRQANPNIVIALAGNKIDLVSGQTATSAAPKPAAPTSSSEDEDEADDATATPGGADGDGEGSESLREVPKEEALAYATEANLLFTEISAKTGEGIVELFTDIGTGMGLWCVLTDVDLLQPRRSPLSIFLRHGEARQMPQPRLPKREVSPSTSKRRQKMHVHAKCIIHLSRDTTAFRLYPLMYGRALCL
jgi:hypothetical protein